MEKLVAGIHHVTAIASDAAKNIDFYAGILGLRMVKKTVNFDARQVYHFYYGNSHGSPGTILTFFPYQGLTGGRHGKGMLNTTTFSVGIDSISFWQERLDRFKIAHKPPSERFRSEVVIYLEDGDGLGLELIFNDRDTRQGYANGNIPVEHSLKGFYNVEIWHEGYERTAAILEELDHELLSQEGNRFRFAATDHPGNYVDVLCSPESLKGLKGSGTVDHVAFSTPDLQTQAAVRERLVNRNIEVTPVKDRNYFSSIYFREPGGVLFEIATAGPGFLTDEPEQELGLNLKLPAQFESDRLAIEAALPPVNFNPALYR
ncbi:ring-cleaving dioxygenase [Flavitalea sp.]|nr:ring-cleaving dioxygenase [Flavitalea sp.]